MRILMLAQFYPPVIGGEERHVRDLATILARRGHWVGVATIWQEGLPEREVNEGVNIFRIRSLTQRWRGLYSDAGRSPLSLVCATKTAMRGGGACSGPGVAKCAVCTSRHYGAAKGSVTLAANWASAMVERRLVDRFLAVSNAVAVSSRLPGGPTPYEIVPNFVRDDIASLHGEADDFVERLPKDPFILYVGDLRRFKGVEVLKEAYAGLERVPPLVLIGRKCQDTPTRWPKNVHAFHDWPHPAIMHAWSRSLIGVLPSIGPEAFGIVLLEAMASGKPVIASTAGGIPDVWRTT